MSKGMRQACFGFLRVGRRKSRERRSRGGREPHRRREVLGCESVVHVTLRVREGLPGMRCVGALEVVRSCMAVAKDRLGVRIFAWSLMSNHFHLVVEAEGSEALGRGMQGLKVRLARGLNRLWGRRGSVFSERYHAELLQSGREVRNALCYVLHNAKRHGCAVSDGVDPFSSGAWFDGWVDSAGAGVPAGVSGSVPVGDSAGVLVSDPVDGAVDVKAPCVAGRTWLLRVGWQRWGLIYPGETPARTFRKPELGRRRFPRITPPSGPTLFDQATSRSS